jgi:hypothetical protein
MHQQIHHQEASSRLHEIDHAKGVQEEWVKPPEPPPTLFGQNLEYVRGAEKIIESYIQCIPRCRVLTDGM